MSKIYCGNFRYELNCKRYLERVARARSILLCLVPRACAFLGDRTPDALDWNQRMITHTSLCSRGSNCCSYVNQKAASWKDIVPEFISC